MRRIRLTATLTAALLLLAGCGAQQGANEGNQQHKEPEQAQQQQQPEPETSERGNLVKHIGDTAYIYADTSEKTEWARWTVRTSRSTLPAPTSMPSLRRTGTWSSWT